MKSACLLRALVGSCFALLLIPPLCDSAGQQIATQLRGTVSDTSGAIIANCKVELRAEDSTSRQTITDESGSYVFPSVSPGKYDLIVSCRAFAESRRVLTISAGQAIVEDVQLSTGPTAKPVEVSPSGARLERVTATWNSWAEQRPFTPEKVLNANSAYRLVLDLGACIYAKGQGLYSKRASEQFESWLKGTEEAVFQVLAVPDSTHIQLTSGSQRAQLLRVNTRHLNRQLGKKLTVPRDRFAALRMNPSANFSFGRVAFSITTTNLLGSTNVFLSLWANGQPVDEVVVPLCVGSENDCSDNLKSTTLRGLDSLRIAAGKGGDELPDAAVHFVTLDDNSVIGVFRCNYCTDWGRDEFHSWRLRRTASWLADYLTKTLLVDFENTVSDEIFLRHGQELFATLFPPEDTGDPARDDDTFLKFLASKGRSSATERPKTIFVRSIFGNDDDLLLVPIGLSVPPGTDQHLGFLYRVELPLPQQRYEHAGTCLSNWDIFLPKRNPNSCDPSNLAACDEMQRLAYSFGDWADELSSWSNHTQSFYDSVADIDRFSKWLNDFRARPLPNQVLLLMSHHDQDRIFFDPSGQNTIEASGVARRFQAPTFVFLNACGTGKPGAIEFVRRFNEHGVNTIIATNATVDAELAGQFAATLLTCLRQHPRGSGYKLGDAWFETLKKVASMTDGKGKKYGARTLAYMLAGDAGMEICVPQ